MTRLIPRSYTQDLLTLDVWCNSVILLPQPVLGRIQKTWNNTNVHYSECWYGFQKFVHEVISASLP